MAIKNKENELIPMIGLEIHCQLNKLNTKLFCGCNAQYKGEEPNKYTCPICLGLPGSLPTLNKGAVEVAITLAHAFHSKINKRMYFFRKNYFYPDLPQNFQITQYNKAGGVAFADGGYISIKDKKNNIEKEVELDRFHLENDPGKIVHMGESITNSQGSLIDYNRSGIALVEIVTKPVLKTPEEARLFCKKLRSIISHCDVVDLTKEGSMRVDANISITGHPRTEMKNINSFKEVEKALKWEIKRQKKVILDGKEVEQETRHWNGKISSTLRGKESESEYRYFPEADLVPIELKEEWISENLNNLPEMPDDKIIRFQKQYSLNEYDADVLMSDKFMADFFEEACKMSENFQAIKNWLMNDIMGLLNDEDLILEETKATPKLLVELIESIEKDTITIKIAKKYIPELFKGVGVIKWMKKKGVKKISDEKLLNELADKIIENNPKVVEDLKKKPKTFQFFVGQIMKETKGQADIKKATEILKKKLAKKILKNFIDEINEKNPEIIQKAKENPNSFLELVDLISNEINELFDKEEISEILKVLLKIYM
ncbi:MAG: Asp-tRNA(Asn)/Glu-tRNA(Gln) amidotransferase subunit GatB [archaeon]|nr:Asp-tRNA(Asn)/Glu-tRNA(Gln) amidotransferase subunit GatB [archaeon]